MSNELIRFLDRRGPMVWHLPGGEECLMSSDNEKHPFDLEERTARFGETIIKFAKSLPRGPGNDRIIGQLVGAGTSVGANYCEADEAVSKKEFTHKIGTCRKEAKETKFFLRMAASAEPNLQDEARLLWKEANELHLIFCTIFKKCRKDTGPDSQRGRS
jgi:four helix bundle protein